MEVEILTAKIRETIGTRFHYGGRVVGLRGGIDCAGILVWSLHQLGYTIYDKPFYNRGDVLTDMTEVLQNNTFFQKGEGETFSGGDVILIRTTEIYHHLVYYTEDETIIHAWVTSGVNKVVESTMLPEWYNSIHSIWRFGDLE